MSRSNPVRPTHRARDRAVSPVIGVVLMVAITVILAAAIGTFVFGLTPASDETAPIASVTFEVDDENVTLVHEGGDTLVLDEFTLLLDGEPGADDALTGSFETGDTLEVDPGWADLTGDLLLRHDPSGEIVASDTLY